MAQQRDLPFLAATAWVGRVGFAAMFGPLAFLFLIFPTGRPPSRRWGWLLRVMAVAYARHDDRVRAHARVPRGRLRRADGPVANPIGLPSSWRPAIEAITTAAGLVVAVGALISVLSLIQRYRRAARLERQQIRWLAFLGVFLGVVLVLSFGLIGPASSTTKGSCRALVFFAFIIGVFLGIPAVCGIAILRHGLWDLDVVVRKTVQYGLLVAGFVLVLGSPSSWRRVLFIGRGGHASMLPMLVVAAVLAVGFTWCDPGRAGWANRIVYGKRATPYEVLSEFAERVGETYSTEDVLPRMAQLLGEATGRRTARVWLRVGDELRRGGMPGPPMPRTSRLPARRRAAGLRATTVRSRSAHQGELLGALTVADAGRTTR